MKGLTYEPGRCRVDSNQEPPSETTIAWCRTSVATLGSKFESLEKLMKTRIESNERLTDLRLKILEKQPIGAMHDWQKAHDADHEKQLAVQEEHAKSLMTKRFGFWLLSGFGGLLTALGAALGAFLR